MVYKIITRDSLVTNEEVSINLLDDTDLFYLNSSQIDVGFQLVDYR